jgi:hypothetical protein
MGKITYERGTRATWTHKYLVNGVAATTGTTLLFTVKKAANDTDATDTTAIIKKNITMSGSTNVITILESDVAPTVAPGQYHYSIKVVDSVSGPLLADSGTFILNADTTNRTS